MRNRLMKLVREPLVHFLIIGAAIYLLYGFSSEQTDGNSPEKTIRVTAGEIRWMEESWRKRWRRDPTPAELQGLIRQRVRETVLYREALAMGLDKDDTIIRRRLAQKLEYLVQDLGELSPPGEKELRDYFAANLDRYRTPDLITFTHVFIDPDKRGANTIRDAGRIRIRLAALGEPAQDAENLGDAFMLQGYYPEKPEAEIAKLFGREFAKRVAELSPRQWHGPVLSGYGTHLVYVHGRRKVPPPAFEALKDRVKQDWQGEKALELNEKYVEKLRSRYKVVIEDGTADKKSADLRKEAR